MEFLIKFAFDHSKIKLKSKDMTPLYIPKHIHHSTHSHHYSKNELISCKNKFFYNSKTFVKCWREKIEYFLLINLYKLFSVFCSVCLKIRSNTKILLKYPAFDFLHLLLHLLCLSEFLTFKIWDGNYAIYFDNWLFSGCK